jgi:NADH-quinone oxidoreductase subunit I
MYDLGSCTLCGLCVQVCPTNAIKFSNDFEQAVFTREKLNKQLNYLPEKDDAPAPAPAAKPAAPAAKPAAPSPEKPADAPAKAAADETKQEPKENKE